MPIENSLNVSELLKRLGVKGDSVGSAPLLEALRLNLTIADLSDLVAPVGVPFGAADIVATSGAGVANQWALRCASPGGLSVRTLRSITSGTYRVWITDTSPFAAAATTSVAHNFAFGQACLSRFENFPAGVFVRPLNSWEFSFDTVPFIGQVLDNWVGPGQFFNIESQTNQSTQEIAITWKEFPAGINP